jgi:transposase-like protein
MILAKGVPLSATHLDFGRRAHSAATQAASQSGPVPTITPAPAEDGKSLAERLLESERKEIVAAVERSRGNIASAARTLGINRSTLYYRLRKHSLEHLLPTKVAVGGEEPGEPALAERRHNQGNDGDHQQHADESDHDGERGRESADAVEA